MHDRSRVEFNGIRKRKTGRQRSCGVSGILWVSQLVMHYTANAQ